MYARVFTSTVALCGARQLNELCATALVDVYTLISVSQLQSDSLLSTRQYSESDAITSLKGRVISIASLIRRVPPHAPLFS